MEPLSDRVQIVNAILSCLGTCFAGYITYLIAKLNQKAGTALNKAEQAINTSADRAAAGEQRMGNLETIANATKENSEAIHVLVNSRMLNQLRISAIALRRIAGITKDPGDIEAARLAEQEYQEQLMRQTNLDAKQAQMQPANGDATP